MLIFFVSIALLAPMESKEMDETAEIIRRLMAAEVGAYVCEDGIHVTVGFDDTDDKLELAPRLKDLSVLTCYRSAVTDEGLRRFRGHQRLRELHMDDCKITGRGL